MRYFLVINKPDDLNFIDCYTLLCNWPRDLQQVQLTDHTKQSVKCCRRWWSQYVCILSQSKYQTGEVAGIVTYATGTGLFLFDIIIWHSFYVTPYGRLQGNSLFAINSYQRYISLQTIVIDIFANAWMTTPYYGYIDNDILRLSNKHAR